MAAFFTMISGITAALSFAVLMLAFVHEWGFFWVIGSRFQSLLSFTDYFTSAIGWLPFTVVGVLAGIFSGLTEDRGLGFPSAQEKDAYYRKHKWHWVRERLPIWIMVGLLLIWGTQEFLFGDWYSPGTLIAGSLIFIAVWIKSANWFFRHEKAPFAEARQARAAIVLAPPLLIWTFMSGVSDAAVAARGTKPTVSGKLENEGVERHWIMLRSLSAGVLVRKIESNDIRFIKWSDISWLQAPTPVLDNSGFLCRTIGKWCPPTGSPH